MIIFGIIITAIFMLLSLYLVKNETTCTNQLIITTAIGSYRLNCILNDQRPDVNYDDMESYTKTLWRLWDWGCKRILPKEKYEIIKDYIGKRGV